jgi:hypothetical protein
MRWTEDREEVEQEKQRLLALQEQLTQAMAHATGANECASWWMMADASLTGPQRPFACASIALH